MKITIEFDMKEELMEPQLASALGELLMNHSSDSAEEKYVHPMDQYPRDVDANKGEIPIPEGYKIEEQFGTINGGETVSLGHQFVPLNLTPGKLYPVKTPGERKVLIEGLDENYNKKSEVGYVSDLSKEEEHIPEDDIPNFEDRGLPAYTLEDIRAKVTSVAVILGKGDGKKGITAMLDWIEEMTGGRQISESDTTHYAAIGAWMDKVLAGGGDE